MAPAIGGLFKAGNNHTLNKSMKTDNCQISRLPPHGLSPVLLGAIRIMIAAHCGSLATISTRSSRGSGKCHAFGVEFKGGIGLYHDTDCGGLRRQRPTWGLGVRRMKLLRYGKPGKEKPGLVDKDGKIRDLSEHLGDFTPETIGTRMMMRLAKIKPERLPLVRGRPRIGPPVSGTRNFIAVGLNYADHAAESGMEVPREPVLFNKAPSCIIGPDDEIIIPKDSVKTDWEVELAIIIGTRASYISEKVALDYVAGFCICNDISERSYQLEGTGQWMKGKGCATFGPIGPYMVTPDEIKDVQNLSMYLELNGKKVQNGSTKTMVFGAAHIVAYISRHMVLEPGDVITTGTPPGVGAGMKPQVFLKPGDVMRVGIEGLGEQRQHVSAWRPV
jgi:2,4-didehydro-3-deoxy-L-rhamnonate hydrolase